MQHVAAAAVAADNKKQAVPPKKKIKILMKIKKELFMFHVAQQHWGLVCACSSQIAVKLCFTYNLFIQLHTPQFWIVSFLRHLNSLRCFFAI